jgi:hypothetical protein
VSEAERTQMSRYPTAGQANGRAPITDSTANPRVSRPHCGGESLPPFSRADPETTRVHGHCDANPGSTRRSDRPLHSRSDADGSCYEPRANLADPDPSLVLAWVRWYLDRGEYATGSHSTSYPSPQAAATPTPVATARPTSRQHRPARSTSSAKYPDSTRATSACSGTRTTSTAASPSTASAPYPRTPQATAASASRSGHRSPSTHRTRGAQFAVPASQ